ncbi:MAG: ATP-binding protein [Candidatus Caenarcaniphilales bacterium]|nr:ATP-binding protein [Candidatus Caenarcaniphilales bacterium]
MQTRSLVKKVKSLLDNFPCVVLIGARQVGKSTLLKQVLTNAKFYDLEREADRQILSTDPDYFFSHTETPLIIDEAQIEPKIFNALRVAIDAERNKKGRYLLSGSSSPHLIKNINESLAGRVAIIEVPNFDWQEAYGRDESQFAKNLFDINALEKLNQSTSHEELEELCLKGSFPEPFLDRVNELFYLNWYENYIKSYIERDIRALFPNLNLEAYRRFISMLSFSSGEIMNYSKLASALDISEPSVKNYLDIAEGTFLWRKLKSFQAQKKKIVIKAPKGHVRDTGLINYFLKIQTQDQLKSHPNYGYIWEVFIVEQILKNMERFYVNFDYYYYRSKNKLEVDFIVESPQGLIPIEIKSGTSTNSKKLNHLKAFIDEYNCAFGILINNGDRIARLSEKIIQVPAVFI